MSNYDFSLDMETDNSNSLILRNIKPGSSILELGCAHGRMTKYLKEQLGCLVFIVEIDEKAGQIAAQYATNSWLGETYGDIDKLQWFFDLKDENIKFDHIICADVLEHINDPGEVLKLIPSLLKENGSIYISIPNVGYNGLIVDLLQDKFEYRDSGILDKTHLKFFTHTSLKSMVENAGLSVHCELNAVNSLANSEFSNSYSQVPKEVADYLQKRKHGEIYQFIWELKKSNVELSIIIPVYNKWNFTKSCLEDLSKLDKAKVEIIVVDNASTDETIEELKTYQQKMNNLYVIQNLKNEGFSCAVNAGYTKAKASYVMFLNNDIRVKDKFETWAFDLLNSCDNNNLVGPTGGKVDITNEFNFLYETNDSTKEINYLSGWCLVAKKEVWKKLEDKNGKIFEEKFFCYFEDTDLSFRAKEMGVILDMTPIPVVHFGKVSSKQLNTYELYRKSKIMFNSLWAPKFNK